MRIFFFLVGLLLLLPGACSLYSLPAFLPVFGKVLSKDGPSLQQTDLLLLVFPSVGLIIGAAGVVMIFLTLRASNWK